MRNGYEIDENEAEQMRNKLKENLQKLEVMKYKCNQALRELVCFVYTTAILTFLL